jgi:hypothetical protein
MVWTDAAERIRGDAIRMRFRVDVLPGATTHAQGSSAVGP